MDVLTVDEAAAFLRLSRQTVTREAKAGRLPCVKAGNRLRFSREALERILFGGNVAQQEASCTTGYIAPISTIYTLISTGCDVANVRKWPVIARKQAIFHGRLHT